MQQPFLSDDYANEHVSTATTEHSNNGKDVFYAVRAEVFLTRSSSVAEASCPVTARLQCMRVTDHITLNFNNNMSTAAVFLDIKKAFDKTWHRGLLYKLYTLKFSISLIKFISPFLSQRKFRASVEGEMSTQSLQAAVPHIPYIVQSIHKS
jgi:hypothetical protein